MDLDDEAKATFKASVLNIVSPVAAPPAASLLAIGPSSFAAPPDSINISAVAAGMGLQFNPCELQSIGVLLKKAYVSKYKAAPDQREQQVATGKIRVNSYTARDLDLMQAAITAFAEQGAPAVGRPPTQSRICFPPVAGPV